MSEKIDHSDLTDEEEKTRGIETDEEMEKRVAEMKLSGKELKAKMKKTMKTQKAAKAAKPKKELKSKTKKSQSERPYNRHKGTKDDPSTGQSAPKSGDLEKTDLNEKEKSVLATLNRAQSGPLSLKDIAERTFSDRNVKEKGTSWARNSLRRLVREGFVKKAGRGEYKAA